MTDKQKLREEIIETTKKVRDTGLIYGKEGFDYLLEVLEEYTDYNDGYNAGVKNGMETAWELSRKLLVDFKDVTGTEFLKIFGAFIPDLYTAMTPQEALAKLKAYEDSKIEVGDVVRYKSVQEEWIDVLCTAIIKRDFDGYQDSLNGIILRDGTITSNVISAFEKTDKHIDIKSILEQIGGE